MNLSRLSQKAWRWKLCAIPLLFALLLVSAQPAWADATLTNLTQPALVSALAQGGLVRFPQDGSITLTNTLFITNQVRLDASGHTVTLLGGGTNVPRLFTVQPGASLTLAGLRLSGGRSTNGGALYLYPGATVMLTDCTFTDHLSTNGGAIYIRTNASVTISNCLFTGNSAVGSDGSAGLDGANSSGTGRNGSSGRIGGRAWGGAIYNAGSLSVFASRFLTNRATGGTGGDGGNGGEGRFRGGNGGSGGKGESAFGGAIYNIGTVFLKNCTLDSNSASGGTGGQGGAGGAGPFGGSQGVGGTAGMGCGAGLYSLRGATVIDCTFCANRAAGGDSALGGNPAGGRGSNGSRGGDSFGGGIYCAGPKTIKNALTNCTFFGNQAEGGTGGDGGPGEFRAGKGGNGGNAVGGGLYSAGTLYVVHCTLAQNGAVGGPNGVAGSAPFSASDGKPGASRGGCLARVSGSLHLANSIVAASTSGRNGYGALKDDSCNLSSDASIRLGRKSKTMTDPRLGPFADNGGPTKTLSLLTNSPALDFATNISVAFDQRGVPRTMGAASDAGAFERVTFPYILTQPQNQTRIAGRPVSFMISAAGDALRYQWQFNSDNIPNATNATFTIPNVAATNAGSYAVLLTNSYGSLMSDVVSLTVNIPPSITTAPTNQSVMAGATAVFSVEAEGDPVLGYQWRFRGTNIAGATGTGYTVSNAQTNHAGPYAVVVTNAFGSITSATATLTINVPPSIAVQPTNQTVIIGSNAVLRVQALGTAPLSYLWQFYGTNLSGGTSKNFYTVTNAQPAHTGPYSVVITNAFGSVTSALATLTVAPPTPPSIGTQPVDQFAAVGSSPSFSVHATGSDPLIYRWLWYGTNLPGRMGAGLSACTVTNAQLSHAGPYSVIVTNAFGSVTSATAQLTVGQAPSIITNLFDQVFANIGSNVSFSITATGSPPLLYRWQCYGTNLPGAMGTNVTTFSIPNAQPDNAGPYQAVITNLFGAITSIQSTLTVLVPPSITAQPTNQAALLGSDASFGLTVTGSAPLTFQWRFNATNLLADATNLTCIITNVARTHVGAYDVVVENSVGSVTSAPALLTLLVPVLFTNLTSDTNSFTFRFQSETGFTYLVEYKNSLADATWTPLTDGFTGTGDWLTNIDLTTNQPTRFYRLRLQ